MSVEVNESKLFSRHIHILWKKRPDSQLTVKGKKINNDWNDAEANRDGVLHYLCRHPLCNKGTALGRGLIMAQSYANAGEFDHGLES